MDSPDRGQVWLVDLGYVAKVRPCLVISIPARNQERALATLVPHTTSSRGSRLEVKVQARFLREGVFDVQNIVTIPHAKLLRKLGNLTSEQMMEVENALLFWLGFEERNDREHPNYVMSINAQKGKKAFVITILVPITQFREPLKIYELPKRLAI